MFTLKHVDVQNDSGANLLVLALSCGPNDQLWQPNQGVVRTKSFAREDHICITNIDNEIFKGGYFLQRACAFCQNEFTNKIRNMQIFVLKCSQLNHNENPQSHTSHTLNDSEKFKRETELIGLFNIKTLNTWWTEMSDTASCVVVSHKPGLFYYNNTELVSQLKWAFSHVWYTYACY